MRNYPQHGCRMVPNWRKSIKVIPVSGTSDRVWRFMESPWPRERTGEPSRGRLETRGPRGRRSPILRTSEPRGCEARTGFCAPVGAGAGARTARAAELCASGRRAGPAGRARRRGCCCVLPATAGLRRVSGREECPAPLPCQLLFSWGWRAPHCAGPARSAACGLDLEGQI